MKKTLSIITIAILMLSMLPAVAPHGVILDQGDKTAALVADVFLESDEKIYVQYLGDITARLHWELYDDQCNRVDNGTKQVTPLEIYEIVPSYHDNGKIIVVVQNTVGDALLNQPLAGIVYYGDTPGTSEPKEAILNMPALTAVATQQGAVIKTIDVAQLTFNFSANGLEYNVFPKDFIDLPFLSNATVNISPILTNYLFINDFNGSDINPFTTENKNDDENVSDNVLTTPPIDCAGLTNITAQPSGYKYNDIGNGVGIVEGIPPGIPTTGAGVGAILSKKTYGRLLAGSALTTGDYPQVITNTFMLGDGEAVTLPMDIIGVGSLPQGLFTGKNENYQNPTPTNALAGLGIQKAIAEIVLPPEIDDINESVYNVETIFAIHNLAPANRTIKARFDYITQNAQVVNECNHRDFEIYLSEYDVGYVRVSEMTNYNLAPGDDPVYGVLTVYDPEGEGNLVGYRWDVIMENAYSLTQCDDGVDNNLNGLIDMADTNNCIGVLDDDETQPGFQNRIDRIAAVLSEEAMLSLDASYENNVATFEAAQHATTYVPTIMLDQDFELVYVNWAAFDDPTKQDQVLNFQVTDDEENVQSLSIPTTECITVLNSQSFTGLSDGTLFGTNPGVISYTGQFSNNIGLAAFLYYNEEGIASTENFIDVRKLAFTNNHHDGEIFSTIKLQPGSLPGPGGETYTVQVGITPSVALVSENVTAGWYATQGLNPKYLGPKICESTVTRTGNAGSAFAIVISGCTVDPLSIDAFLKVNSTLLGDVELFVPATN